MRQYLLLLLVAASSLAHSPLRFDNFQVYRVTPQNFAQLQALKRLEELGNGYNFWTEVGGFDKPVDIMVPPHMKYDFEDFVKLQYLRSELYIENVQKLIDEQTPVHTARNQTRDYNWKYYQTNQEVSHI